MDGCIAEDDLLDLARGGRPLGDTPELEAHLADCSSCSALLATLLSAPRENTERRDLAGRRLGPYQLDALIGAGAMGEVYRGWDLRLHRHVAVKVLSSRFAESPERVRRLEAEGRAAAAIAHPNVVTVYDVGSERGVPFIVSELIEGESLRSVIDRGPIPRRAALGLGLQLARGLAAAHARGVVHRDLKPGNLIVTGEGTLKILDFGLARILPSVLQKVIVDDDRTATLDSGFVGTIAYMSPEQLRSEPLDHRTDIFSLGVVLFEWATGGLPFRGKSNAATIAAVLKEDPRPATEFNPRLPRHLDRILRHCLEKEPRYRMASARDLREELELLRQEGAGAPGDEVPSIAVLPFVDMSREKDQSYFCEGIAEEIINALCRVQGLRVASRTGSFQFRDSTIDLREVANNLHVGAILEGSVRKSENRLRITVQLVEATRGFHLWSESYDREMRDIFAIQQEIARSVVRALQVTLSPQEKGALSEIPTRHVQAYDYYLKGRSFYYRYGRHDIEFALQLFSRATELDPEYALAQAGLADCWSYIYLYSERKDSVRLQAETAGRRAVDLAPESAQAQASLAVALSLGSHKEEAQAAFEKAIRLDPGLFEAWYFYARHAFAGGDLPKAAALYEEAIRVRPEDYYARLLVGPVYDRLGRTEDARAARERGVALVERHIDLHPDDARALYMGGIGLVSLGMKDKGLDWARRARKIDPDDPMLLYNLGCLHSLNGDVEEAIDCLERAVAGGLLQKGWYENDGDLDPLRGHPRFKTLLESMG